MEKILISACLLGDKCRYDGGDNYFPFIEELQKHYELVAFCPEMAANLGCPRDPAEIKNDRVVTEDGRDLTEAYNSAAEQAVRLCNLLGIRIAILKDKSPACGSRHIHNGLFMGNTIEGLGVTAAALIRAGVRVYAETDALAFLLPEVTEKKASTGRYKGGPIEKKAPVVRKARPISKRDDERKPFHKDGERKPFRKDGDHKPYGEKKSFDRKPYSKDGKPFDRKPRFDKDGERKPYHKDGERKSYGEKKGNNSYHKERSFSRNKEARSSSSYGRKPYDKKRDFKK